MTDRHWNASSSTSPGVPPSKRSEPITWEQQQEEVEEMELLKSSTKSALFKQTMASLRLLSTEIDRDRWLYE
jgi:hypothetical protein